MYEEKVELRKRLIAKRGELTDEYIEQSSKAMFEKIKQLDCFKKCKTIMIYVSYKKEINTHDFIRECIAMGKRVVTPTCIPQRNMLLALTTSFDKGFERTKMGILEIPAEKAVEVPADEVDIIITPGLAFTPEGMRIGYGGGYYDRLFSKIRSDCIKLAPSFDSFVIDSIPTGKYDRPVNIIVTEKKIIFASV